MTPDDEQLKQIIYEYGLGHQSIEEAVQAIKEWSCHQRGCEPEKIPVRVLGIEHGRMMATYEKGPCIHCGGKEEE